MERKCIQCGKSLKGLHRNRKFCSDTCRATVAMQTYRERNPKSLVGKGTVGAISEYRIIADLLNKGYEVFHSCCPNSSCDLAILKDEKLLRIEVTTGWYSGNGNIHYAPHKPNNFDTIAIVLPNEILYKPHL